MKTQWREVVRAETEHPPQGAKARVWRALHEPKLAAPRRAPWVLSLTLAATAGIALTLGLRTPTESRTWATSGSVVALANANATFDPASNTLTLKQGTVAASVWAQPALRLNVHGRQVEVEAAELVVKAAGDTVVIAPTQGWILVDGERVEATAAAPAGVSRSDLAPLQARVPSDVANRQAQRRAELAVEGHRWEEAVHALDEVGHSGTLAAEAAVLRKGELELRQLNDAHRALATFDEAATRFPRGSLAQERELSALEALVKLEQWNDVARRAGDFRATFPKSERTLEVQRAQVSALLQLGRHDEACLLVRALGPAAGEFRRTCQK